jgi:hypothetical protein
MNIVLSGIWYPVAILRYVEAALRRRTDINLCTVGRYTGRTIPWGGGMVLGNVPEAQCAPPDLILTAPRTPISYVEANLPWKPDVWFQMNSTDGLIGKPSSGKNLIVGVDPHCIDYTEARQYADTFFCMQTPYMRGGDVWLPYAYDPIWHAPAQAEVVRQYDGGLVGAPYRDRVKLAESLRASGYNILFTGYGPTYNEARDLYHQCKIGLNWSTREDLCARVFEVAAMGLCPVVNRVPDLEKMGWIEGTHYFGFSTLSEGLQRFVDALQVWEQTAKQACEFVAPHTWDARVETVLSYA